MIWRKLMWKSGNPNIALGRPNLLFVLLNLITLYFYMPTMPSLLYESIVT
jgi:hypothetical protein